MNVKDYRRKIESELAQLDGKAGLESLAGTEHDGWQQAINQLQNPDLTTDLRIAALQRLQAGTFLGLQFESVRADYVAALRNVVTASDDKLRLAALDVLVNLKDDFARQKLQDSLRGIGQQLLAPAAALGLLARDDHGSAAHIARDLLFQSKDVPLRAQAARLLGGDPSAKGLLAALMQDKDEFREVRRASAVSLRNLDPSAFAQAAGKILADGSDFKDIKATVRGALNLAQTSAANTTAAVGWVGRTIGAIRNILSGS
jgi:hypothetical protein